MQILIESDLLSSVNRWCGMKTFVLSAVIILALLLVGTLGCRHPARPDDNLEPNDDFEHATVLTADHSLTGRANEGNMDVFAFDLEEEGRIIFSLESIGLEECARFTVTGPDDVVLYQEGGVSCSRRVREVQADCVVFREIEDFGYEITIANATTGKYFLSIFELGQVDNIYPFSWDYRLTVKTEQNSIQRGW